MKKEIYASYFEGKKVTALGLGLLGRGLGDTEFLLKNVKEVICTDTRDENKLAESIQEITKDNPKNLTLIIAENRMEDFENRDFIITCAGMQRDYPYLVHAKENNIPIYMSAALVTKILYEKMPSVRVIGVTGTRGKSTTTHMIAHIVRASGMRVHLGGNVRGVANLPLLNGIEEGDIFLCELDSWQLQGYKDIGISPHIAVFTSFLDDHLNYYKGDREAYFNDKAGIFINQKKEDILIASPQAHSEILKRGYGGDAIVPEINISAANLIGHHNDVSASLAYEVAKCIGIDNDHIKNALSFFLPVEGRLEYMGKIKGVDIYNDNNATTPDATIAGVRAIVEKYNKKPILLLGGADKGLDLTLLEKEIKEYTKAYVLLAGTGTDKLHIEKINLYERLEDAVSRAFEMAEEGDVILFSPAFASFSPYFKNEYEKNDEFVKEINSRRQ